ncbi:MAG: NAD(P)-dependent alcohol dehydrogenase [Micrococcales bacterium]|nr:NAD(P)-dependent alcohol dehydrogenase [Micrococcales bacterium]
MRASVLVREGEIRLESRAVPVPDAGEVLVQVEAVGVCGSDVHYYRHGRIGPYIVDEPLVLGHEASGRIVAVGSDVDPGRIGSRVSIEPQRPCGRCRQCREARYNLCERMEFYATPPIDGAFAEYVLIHADFAHDLPDGVSWEAGALLEPLSVAIWACRKAGIGLGSRVLVAGAGPVGVLVAQTARALGAREVTVSDVSPERLALAAELGATRVLDAREPLPDELRVDAFIDASGAEPAVRAGIRAVDRAGRAVLVGLGAEEMALPVSHIQNFEILVTGVFRYAHTWPAAIQLVAEGRVDLDALVTSRHPLEEVEAALTIGSQPGQMKAVVQPQL